MASNANLVILMGNLTRNPELRYTSSGRPVATLGIAVNRSYKDANTGQWVTNADFFTVSVWGATAENCDKYLSKGRGVYIEGRLAQSKWTTPEGETRSKVEVIARTVQFLPGSGAASAPESQGGSQADEDIPEEYTESVDEAAGDDEEIPF